MNDPAGNGSSQSAPAAAQTPRLSPRSAALRLLVDWDRGKYIFIDALVQEFLSSHSYPPSDAGLIAEICYGAIRHRNTLRMVSARYAHQELEHYPRPLRMALALGLYQLIYLGTPAHAAVDESVSAWDEFAAGEHVGTQQRVRERGFLNACLRNAVRDLRGVAADTNVADDVDTIHTESGWVKLQGLGVPSRAANLHEMLSLKYSHPAEMVRLWLERWGEQRTVEFMVLNNRTPSTYLIVKNGNAEAYLKEMESAGFAGTPGELPGTVLLKSGALIPQLPGYKEGAFWVQDLTSNRLANMMPARKGATLLDLCAAPGGKLSALLARGDYRDVLAADVSFKKLRLLTENLARLGFPGVKVDLLEAPEEPSQLRIARSFDQILVDAPCSNTGVLARRHEARWRLLPEVFNKLHRAQLGLLRAAARHLNRGGDLLYLTCSLEPMENSEVVHDFLRGAPELRLVREEEHSPRANLSAAGGLGPADGGYGALMRRS